LVFITSFHGHMKTTVANCVSIVCTRAQLVKIAANDATKCFSS